MTIAHLLEEYGRNLGGAIRHDAVMPSADITETIRLEAYEDGYKAGWDDAVGANQAEQMQVAADLAQNIKDMSFTYQEACTEVSKSLRGVFDAMLSLFLPEVARVALAPKVAEELEKLPLNADSMRIVLSVAPESRPILERLTQDKNDDQLTLQEDTSLTGGQVIISFGENEVSVDFDALLEEMKNALEMFNYELNKEEKHG